MNRILNWLALVAGLAIVIIALYEINHREANNNLAIPTAVPSPSSTVASPESSAEASAAPATSEETAAPSVGAEGAASAEPAATETVAPPPTATPEPPLPTHNPADISGEPTAKTGANPVPGGVAIALLASTAFVVERRKRRHT